MNVRNIHIEENNDNNNNNNKTKVWNLRERERDMDDGTLADVRSHGKNLPGGQRSQLGQSLIDALTNVPVGQGKKLMRCPSLIVLFANPDCCNNRCTISIIWDSEKISNSIYSSSLFPTPLN